jgi:hypothetical protein
MRAKLIAFLAAILLLAGASGSFASIMYLDTTGDSLSSLYTLSTGGVTTKVGDIYNGANTPNMVDIAYDFSNQEMYAITRARLWTLDYLHPSSGVVTATLVGNTGTTGIKGLEVIGSILYAGTANTYWASGALYTLNPTTGVATRVGNSFGTWGGNSIGLKGDLAYSNGILYATMDWTGHLGTYLATIDLSTGTATRIAQIGYTSSRFHRVNLDGIVFMDGILYGTTRGNDTTPAELYSIDPTTALVTDLGPTHAFVAHGLTQVPCPSTALLLGSGLLGLAGLRNRFRKI